ncbi:AAA family ATPase [Acetivibrio straminisolvens]|jgi:SpoVK/Ycf46/Vps4 family AAA+-type ATPase|uniref:AAA family ATPase n=1 Tax=Acetivibrio straminisolvens TaxID=253314 RepID=UPI0022405E23|nr:AAA family ATPase [Acetivibrio straminisolvens]
MSTLSQCRELLKRYSTARIPFIAINTIERGRTLELLKDVSDSLSLTFYVHTLSKGTYELGTGKVVNEDKAVYGAIDFMSEQMKRRQYLTFVLTETPDLSTDNSDSRQMLDLVTLAEESGGVVIVLTNNPVWNQLQRLGMVIKLDSPDEDEMYEIIKEYIDDYRNEITIEWDNNDIREAAAALAGVTRIEAQNVIAALIANKKITKEDLAEVRSSKDRLFHNISGLERIEVDPGVSDVGGLDGLRKWLDEKRQLFTPEKRDEMRSRGLLPPRGILLVGVPGCGKSLSAKSIAAKWKFPLYRLDFATVQGSYVGQSEQQLKDALTTAENVAPCILWIDEIEKGLSGVGSNNDGGVSTRMVGQFLFWMQECKKQVFVVATANDVSMLPSELLRRGRFDEIFFVDLPTAEERKEIITLYTKKYIKAELSPELLDKIIEISDGFTGADIESCIRDIAYRVLANENFALNDENIITAFSNVIPLSQTAPERIESIRNWGKERAVPASGRPIGSTTFKKAEPKVRKVLV